MTKDSRIGVEDLTSKGFTADDITAMFYAREPLMINIIRSAMELSEQDRFLAITIIQAIAAVAAVHGIAAAADLPSTLAA